MIIYYNGDNQHSISAGPLHRVVLNPGQNIVDDEVWKKIVESAEKEAKNPKNKTKGGVLYLQDEGLIKVLDDEMQGGHFTISAFNQKDAFELIDAEVSVDNLKEFLRQERDGKDRDKIVKKLEKKIIAIEEAEAKGGTSDD